MTSMLLHRKENIMTKIFSFLLFLLFVQISFGQDNIAEGFYDELVVDGFALPLGIRFDDIGNAYVWEKGGKVFFIDTTHIKQETPILDLSEEVMEFRDLGMLGFALDPAYISNGFIYALYTVDKHYLLDYGSINYNPDSTIITEPTISRLTRFTMDFTQDKLKIVPDSRTVLIGSDIHHGMPMMSNYHGTGSLVFGDDGSLLISVGDGGRDVDENAPNPNFAEQAVQEGIIKEKEFIHYARAQLLDNYNGKILRVDPKTGLGYPSNPFYQTDNPNSIRSKIYALGLRNPYRFFQIPGTGAHDTDVGDPGYLIIGDVGPGGWEELNYADKSGENFGWPYFEGNKKHWPQFWTLEFRNLDASNPLYGIGDCDQQYFKFQDLLNEPNAADDYNFPNPCDQNFQIPDSLPKFIVKRPEIVWSNKSWNPPVRSMVNSFTASGEADEIPIDSAGIAGEAFAGFSSIPGFWYESGYFPEAYNHSAFVADYSGWIRVFHFSDWMDLYKISTLRTKINGIVDLEFNPHNQSLYYVNINTHQLRKISFGGNPAPVAIAHFDTNYGYGDTEISFSASDSYDPNELPISYHWEFGDGTTSTLESPIHLYSEQSNTITSYNCILTVTDSLGASATDEVIISLNNTPPQVDISNPQDGDVYPVSAFTLMAMEAEVNDAEHVNKDLHYAWTVYFHHNEHYHEEPVDTSQSPKIIIDPVGCENELFWYRIGLKVTDAHGLFSTDEIQIYPDCEDPFGIIQWISAFADDGSINLIWKDENQNEKESYTIQRFNKNSIIEDIGEIIINSQGQEKFSFTDLSPIYGANVNRLKSNHVDGRYDYSNTIEVSYPQEGSFHLSPNPSSGIIAINYTSSTNENTIIEIYSADGKRVFHSTIQSQTGEHIYKIIDLTEISEGVYHLRLTSEAQTAVKTFIINRS